MKKIILILTIILVLVSCEYEFPKETCNFCVSTIAPHRMYSDFVTTRYNNQSVTFDGKKYHPWCLKFQEINSRKK